MPGLVFTCTLTDVVLLMCLSEEAIQVMKKRWKSAKHHAKVDGLRNLLDGGVRAEVFAREDMPALTHYIEDSEERESTALEGRGAVREAGRREEGGGVEGGDMRREEAGSPRGPGNMPRRT